jgi:hypothetical protein
MVPCWIELSWSAVKVKVKVNVKAKIGTHYKERNLDKHGTENVALKRLFERHTPVAKEVAPTTRNKVDVSDALHERFISQIVPDHPI